jgi:hypothetical protein
MQYIFCYGIYFLYLRNRTLPCSLCLDICTLIVPAKLTFRAGLLTPCVFWLFYVCIILSCYAYAWVNICFWYSLFTIYHYLEFISLDMQGHSTWFIHLLFDLIVFFPCIFLIHFVVIFLVFEVSGDLPAKSPALKLCLVTRDVGFYILFARDVHNYYLASIFLGFVYGFIYVWA